MSLFQFQEWFSATQPNSFSLAIAKLIEERDQIIVGSLDGIIAVFDPGREPDHRNEMGGLATVQISLPILQLSTGYFLPSSYGPETIIIVALTPSTLIYLKINQNAQTSFECEQLFEHKIPGPPAFNFCQGYFGRGSVEQICVQSLQGGLILYEAENKVLQRSIPDILHPGPLGYSSNTESIIIASGGYLKSVRYNTLIATGTKQIYIDWTLPLGDWAIQMVILLGDSSTSFSSRPSSAVAFNSSTSAQNSLFPPSIIVLCKRILYCITHNGSLRYSIRLQTVALSLHILPQGRNLNNKINQQQQTILPIPIIIGTGGKTLLFYSDNKLIWNVQLPFAAQIVETCTFNDSLRSMIVLLSENSNNLLVGYLGTEPSLFKMPASETRFINFEEKKKELREFEKIIFLSGREGENKEKINKKFNIEINIDKNSKSFNLNEGIKSATIKINFNEENKINGELILNNNNLYCLQGNHQILKEIEKFYSFTLFCHENTVLDNKIQILLIIEAEYNLIELFIPLLLICREVPPQRQATFKLSIDSTQPALDIDILFPEFSRKNPEYSRTNKNNKKDEEIEKEISPIKNNPNNIESKRTSIALQPFFGESNTTVSLFISTKTNRYRIQSDNTDFVFVIFSNLIERIQKNQPEARLHCPVPLHLCLTEIFKYIEAEEECDNLEKQANILAKQIRQVETVFLSRLKSSQNENLMENYERMPIEALFEYTHKELIKILDQLNSLMQGQLSTKKRKSLGSLLNLMNSTLKLYGIQLPFDGRILEGNDQTLSEQLFQLLNSQKEINKKLNSSEIGNLLTNFCERNEGNLRGIVEEEEDEEEEEENEINKEKEKEKELNEVLIKSEEFMEFVEFESGSLQQNE
ncbi:hypothetical protein ACQ4LE_002882 [Meloidogyne hapla]